MTRTKHLFNPESAVPFCVSRTKLQDFQKCPRCFYLDRRLGVSKPSMPAFSLNVAVDALLKKEFDTYRKKKKPHPIMIQYGLHAIPFQHHELDLWRNNFKGIRHLHKWSNLFLYGAVDDLWIFTDGSIAVVDYKATSTRQEITLSSPYREGYKKQLEIYQWLFAQEGFDVSPRSFILYVNGKSDRDAFNNRLEFDAQIIEHVGDCGWVDGAMVGAKDCLMGELPEPREYCEWCHYGASLRQKNSECFRALTGIALHRLCCTQRSCQSAP